MKKVKSIFARNRRNSRRIHLHLWEDKWCTVERSAYYFATLFKTDCPGVSLCDGRGNRIVAICTDPCFELREPVVANTLSITRVDSRHIVIRLDRPLDEFKWRITRMANKFRDESPILKTTRE